MDQYEVYNHEGKDLYFMDKWRPYYVYGTIMGAKEESKTCRTSQRYQRVFVKSTNSSECKVGRECDLSSKQFQCYANAPVHK